MRKAFFFDLDGTLLPLDMDAFTRTYYTLIKKSGFFDMIGEKGEEIFGKGVGAMLFNDGSQLNKDAFLETVSAASGKSRQTLLSHMERFYETEFDKVRDCAHADPRVAETIRVLKDKGYRLVLTTNPLFPPLATNMRIEWAGLKPDDFEYITYYDNSHYCKPNPEYFKEVLNVTGLEAHECYVVGNDVCDDLSAVALGFKAFLVLDHVIGDLGKVPECVQGDYSDLLSFAKSLPQI